VKTVRIRCAAVVLLALLAVSVSEAAPAFRYERTVRPGGAGPNRLAPDAAILTAAKPVRVGLPGGLEDLRLFDAGGREVPYLLVAPQPRERQWVKGSLAPIPIKKKSSGFEADLGKLCSVDRLAVTGIPGPFLKRFRLEGSGDRSHWVVLVSDGTLFDLPEERLRRTEVEFPAGEYRYLRVTFDDRQSARAPMPSGASARLVAGPAPPPPARIEVLFERRASEPGRSRFRIRLPGPHLPVVALELSVAGGNLLRPAAVTEARLSNDTLVPSVLGRSTLHRAEIGGLAAADLRVPIEPPNGPDLELVVDDGDNPPLALTGVSAELAPLPWIYFESPDGAALTARYGDPELRAPRYDIESMRRYVSRRALEDAAWGPARDLAPEPPPGPAAEMPSTGAPIDPAKFRYHRPIPASPAGLTSLLLDAAVLAHVSDVGQVRICDASGRQIPFILEKRAEPLSIDLPPLSLLRSAEAAASRVSKYRVELPYASLPPSRLVVTTAARIFERNVTLLLRPARPPEGAGRRDDEDLETVASAAWRHADADTPAPALVLDLPTLEVKTLELDVDEGDNRPLPLGVPRLLLPTNRLRFYRPAQDSLTLLYGNPDLAAPRYDVALLSASLLGAPAGEIALATEKGPEPPTPPVDTNGTRIFWAALIVATLLLLVVIARLVRRVSSEESGAPPPE
jgi:Protein of unknown function (DUF3999)